MIFDDINQPAPPKDASRRRRHRSRPRGRAGDDGPRRRRSTFESASKFTGEVRDPGDRSTVAWLSMLAVLVLAVGGFALFLQQQKSSRTPLIGQAPSTLLLPFIDPILAPLETGAPGCDAEALDRVASQLQTARVATNRDDSEVYTVAGTIASILQEALSDRTRHLQRLVDLGSPVVGLSEGGAPKNPEMTETQKQHLELAVGVSWQRNSVTYRNRAEELWYRLLRLEQGRFREGSASTGMVPPMRAPSTNE